MIDSDHSVRQIRKLYQLESSDSMMSVDQENFGVSGKSPIIR